MEILYGIVLLIVFVLGIGIGILIPFFIRKYIDQANRKIEHKENDSNVQKKDLVNLTPEVRDEWWYGKEGVE